MNHRFKPRKRHRTVCRSTMRSVILLLTLSLPSIKAHKRVRPRHCGGDVKHIHLAVGHDPAREMTVSFASKWGDPGVEAPLGGVYIGLRPDELDRFVPEHDYPINYTETLPETGGKVYYSPFQHHITITDLEPGTTYYYVAVDGTRDNGIAVLADKLLRIEDMDAESRLRQQDEEQNAVRFRRRLEPPAYDGSMKPCIKAYDVRSFTTAPDSSDSPVSFAIVGDLGQFSHSQETLVHMKYNQNDIDAVMLVGDIAYTGLDHRAWDTFFDFLDDYSFFDEVPLQIATGNHDIEKLEDGNNVFLAYENRFMMPQVQPAQLDTFDFPGYLNMDAPPYPLPYDWGNAYYSFTYGPAKHVVVSAYSNMDPGSLQYDWLISEFESVDRTRTPWLLVSIHTPLYNTFHKHKFDPQIVAAKEHLEPLLVKYNVNVVFTGHIHAYQRTKNVAMERLDPKAPMHLTIGAGGRQCNAAYDNATAEEWIEARDSSFFGYGKFSIFNRTHAEWKWIPLSQSEKHPRNTVSHNDDLVLASLAYDHVVMENQYFLEE